MNKWIIICFTLAFAYHTSASKKRPKIAVIGAGIGGASAASFMTDLFHEDGVDIDIYEKLHVGGRLFLSELNGHFYEMGGTAIHPRNKYMLQFVKDLGLGKRHVFGIRLGIFDGKKYVFMEGDRSISSFGKLFNRYGDSMSDWHNIVDDVLNRFLRIYEMQDEGYAFTSVEKLLSAIDPVMLNLTQTTTTAYLLKQNLLPMFVNELVKGIIKIAYGQSPDVNAFVGTISLAGAKAGLWGVRGGNEQVPQKLIEKYKADLSLKKVTKIVLKPDGLFEVHSSEVLLKKSQIRNEEVPNNRNENHHRQSYDMVVVATPLIKNLSGISFEGFPGNTGNFKGQYQESVTTLVNGTVNTNYLETNKRESQLDEVLTVANDCIFNSLSRVYPVDVDEEINQTTKVWKVSSSRPLTEDELNLIFSERRATTRTHWLAHPYYRPPESLGPFVLYPGLFYTSSIDWAASAIEMSAISGKNAALLAYYHWTNKQNFVDSFPGHKEEL